MAFVYHIGVVPESDFLLFTSLCVHSMVGDSYSDYLQFLQSERARLNAADITVIDVPIDAVGFQHWLNGRIATPSDLCTYATHVSDRH